MYGIFTYIYHKNKPNVGKYTRQYIDPMGYDTPCKRTIWDPKMEGPGNAFDKGHGIRRQTLRPRGRWEIPE